jgi:hypothetical protein
MLQIKYKMLEHSIMGRSFVKVLCNFVKIVFLVFYICKDCGYLIVSVSCEIFDNI